MADAVMEWATSANELLGEIKRNVPADFFTRGCDVEFQMTPKGRVAIGYDDLLFFRDDHTGLPVVARTRGDRAEFCVVACLSDDVEDWDWSWAPLGDPALN